MALPALAEEGADVLVLAWLAPLVEMAGIGARVMPFERGWPGWRSAVRRLRAGRYERGTLLSAAFSAAWLFRWGGVRHLRGTATDGRSWLLNERIPREALRGHHRIDQYRMLLGREAGAEPRLPALTPPPEELEGWRTRMGGAAGPLVGFFPGSNAPARRWPPQRFAEVGKALASDGARVVVMGAPAERELTAAVAREVPGAVDAGGSTDLPGLAALLSLCDLVVTNDTGPMHVAAAVGTPTVSLWGPSDPDETAPPGVRHETVSTGDLPCRPCLKNVCPRSGRGTVLPQAHEECMALIEVERVLRAARRTMEAGAR
ncbi:MAG TPA: glycosyltransferase family 9 protein [Longimicrobiales bacterium]|nr:glycosyltransferase family 9 protein [Longimicrobiales bacterium]